LHQARLVREHDRLHAVAQPELGEHDHEAAGRRSARLAFAIPALAAATLSLVAFAADGDLGAAGLTSAEVGYQVLVAVATLALVVLIAARLRETRRAVTAAA
jgi:hypothetical protein